MSWPPATRRELMWTKAGPESIKSTCSLGHTITAPNKGLGRAKVAAWESRHQHREVAS